MTEPTPIDIELTIEFQRKIRILAKKYRRIRIDLQEVLQKLQAGEFVGDQLQDVGSTILKARVKNSDAQRGKSGGYRLIYWLQSPATVVLLDIYSKSEQENIEVDEIQRILMNHKEN
ncbi:MAG: type II toxin-antitoxin system RelE/ParE family toxin [Timaviella obliquedivisa GSE-PSE-MK23-08B]|nr:type II toxin-antitoxin system RelE/ParE family toxin [Timaviella obliquedivisa GSE-PSE-MK23-08B]